VDRENLQGFGAQRLQKGSEMQEAGMLQSQGLTKLKDSKVFQIERIQQSIKFRRI